MLKGGSILRLHEMKLKGKKIREIARDTGHSRNTIRKYVRDGHIPESESKEREKRGSKLDPFKETIDRWMKEDGLFNCQAMFMRLKEKGYTGGATIIKDYVQGKRPPKQPKATVRYETLPGEQAQILRVSRCKRTGPQATRVCYGARLLTCYICGIHSPL